MIWMDRIRAYFTPPEPPSPFPVGDLAACREYVLRRDAAKRSRAAHRGWDTRRAGA